ncbi:unnamed protein product [Discosporangium mesarthrocarpum]
MLAKRNIKETRYRNAKPAPRPYKLFDGGGLYLLVNPDGSKYWRIKYRFAGKERLLAVGVYGNKHGQTTLDEARQALGSAKAQLKDGKDPSIEKKKAKLLRHAQANTTFESVAREWVTFKSNRWTPGHTQDVLRSLEADVFPQIGNIPISEINRSLLRPVLEAVQSRGALEATKRLRQRCSGVFRYAMVSDLCSQDPANELRDILIPPKKKHLPALEFEELPGFLQALNKYNCNLQTRLAVRLMLLTFVRTGELCGGRWEEIDFQKRVWNIPAGRMKKDRPHFIPLSDQAMDVLFELHKITGHWSLMFPKRGKPREQMSTATILRVIDRLGYIGKMTGHGF